MISSSRPFLVLTVSLRRFGGNPVHAVFFKLNQGARNPVPPSAQAASYTQQTFVTRFATRRNSLSHDLDPDGPFLEEPARLKRTTFLIPRRPLRLSCSSGLPPASRNPPGDYIPASSTPDA